MAQIYDWVVLSFNPSVTIVDTSEFFDYDLFNSTLMQVVKYGEREYGINLVRIGLPVVQETMSS